MVKRILPSIFFLLFASSVAHAQFGGSSLFPDNITFKDDGTVVEGTGKIIDLRTGLSVTFDSLTSTWHLASSGSGATSLTGLSDVGSATVTAGNLLIADGTKFQSTSMNGDCTITSSGAIDCPSGAGATSLTGLSDVGSATISAGRLLIADGTDFQSVAVSGDATISSAGVIDLIASSVGTGELSNTAVTSGTYARASIVIDADGRITGASSNSSGATSLTGLSDVGSATVSAGRLLVADGTKFQTLALSGDATISSAGAIDLIASSVGTAELSNTSVTSGTYAAASIVIDADGRITGASSSSGGGATSLTGLSDVGSATISAGRLLVADGTKFQSLALSGDATISSAGAIDLIASSVGTAELSNTTVTSGTYARSSIVIDADGRITGASSNPDNGATSLTGLSDVGSATVSAGRLLIADGTKFQSLALSGDATISSAGAIDLIASSVGTAELSNTTVTSGTYAAASIVIDADGRITGASSSAGGGATSLTGLSDVGSATASAGRLLIADGTKFQALALSGDATISSAGAIDLIASSVGTAELSNTSVTSGSYNFASLTVDADGRITAASSNASAGATSLTGLSDVGSATVTAGRILVANGTKFQSVAVSDGAQMDSTGGLSLNYAAVFLPQQAKLPNVGPMAIDAGNNNWRGLYDAASSETGRWSGNMAQYNGTGLNAQICYSMASATSGTVEFDMAFMCNSSGDAVDIDTDSFGSENVFTETVPGTAGYESCISGTALNQDSCAEGDDIFIRVFRDAVDGTNDTATGDAELRSFTVYE